MSEGKMQIEQFGVLFVPGQAADAYMRGMLAVVDAGSLVPWLRLARLQSMLAVLRQPI